MEDNNIFLDEFDDTNLILDTNPTDLSDSTSITSDLTQEQGFEYPSILICGLTFADSLSVLKSIKRPDSFRLVDVWVQSEDGSYFNMGKIQLDSTFLLTAKYLRLSITLYPKPDTILPLDLNDATSIIKYI